MCEVQLRGIPSEIGLDDLVAMHVWQNPPAQLPDRALKVSNMSEVANIGRQTLESLKKHAETQRHIIAIAAESVPGRLGAVFLYDPLDVGKPKGNAKLLKAVKGSGLFQDSRGIHFLYLRVYISQRPVVPKPGSKEAIAQATNTSDLYNQVREDLETLAAKQDEQISQIKTTLAKVENLTHATETKHAALKALHAEVVANYTAADETNNGAAVAEANQKALESFKTNASNSSNDTSANDPTGSTALAQVARTTRVRRREPTTSAGTAGDNANAANVPKTPVATLVAQAIQTALVAVVGVNASEYPLGSLLAADKSATGARDTQKALAYKAMADNIAKTEQAVMDLDRKLEGGAFTPPAPDMSGVEARLKTIQEEVGRGGVDLQTALGKLKALKTLVINSAEDEKGAVAARIREIEMSILKTLAPASDAAAEAEQKAAEAAEKEKAAAATLAKQDAEEDAETEAQAAETAKRHEKQAAEAATADEAAKAAQDEKARTLDLARQEKAQEVSAKALEAKEKEVEAKRIEEDAKKLEEQMKVMLFGAKSKQEEASKKEEEARAKEQDAIEKTTLGDKEGAAKDQAAANMLHSTAAGEMKEVAAAQFEASKVQEFASKKETEAAEKEVEVAKANAETNQKIEEARDIASSANPALSHKVDAGWKYAFLWTLSMLVGGCCVFCYFKCDRFLGHLHDDEGIDEFDEPNRRAAEPGGFY